MEIGGQILILRNAGAKIDTREEYHMFFCLRTTRNVLILENINSDWPLFLFPLPAKEK